MESKLKEVFIIIVELLSKEERGEIKIRDRESLERKLTLRFDE